MAHLKSALTVLAAAMAALAMSQSSPFRVPSDLTAGIVKLKRSGMLMGLQTYLGHPQPPGPEDFLLVGLIVARNLELVASSLEDDGRASPRYLLTKLDFPAEVRYWDQVPEFCRTADDALDIGASGLGMEGSALEMKHSQIAASATKIRIAVKKLEAFYRRVHLKEALSAPSWARPAVTTMLDNGLLNGYPDGTF